MVQQKEGTKDREGRREDQMKVGRWEEGEYHAWCRGARPAGNNRYSLKHIQPLDTPRPIVAGVGLEALAEYEAACRRDAARVNTLGGARDGVDVG